MPQTGSLFTGVGRLGVTYDLIVQCVKRIILAMISLGRLAGAGNGTMSKLTGVMCHTKH